MKPSECKGAQKPAPSNPEPTSNIDEQMNTMAPNEEDMKQLGRDMKRMKTNSELEEKGIVPDPQQ